jgi:hypothetical protein
MNTEQPALKINGLELYFMKDNVARKVRLGFVFRHRHSGKRFSFGHGWWDDVSGNMFTRLFHIGHVPEEGQTKKKLVYLVNPPWEAEQTSPEETMDVAKQIIQQAAASVLPPGTRVDIKIKLPVPLHHIDVDLMAALGQGGPT